MKYFVIVYNQASGVVGIELFPETAGQLALERRFELELQNREQPGIEVVMLGADSEEALRRTHSRYFKSLKELSAAS